MDMFVKTQLPTLRKLRLCARPDTFAKLVLPLSAGLVIFVNQVQAHQHQRMVRRATFVRQVIFVRLEQQLKLPVLLGFIIPTKVALIFLSVKSARQEQLAPTQAPLTLPQ
jgi:hypothetical protein